MWIVWETNLRNERERFAGGGNKQQRLTLRPKTPPDQSGRPMTGQPEHPIIAHVALAAGELA